MFTSIVIGIVFILVATYIIIHYRRKGNDTRTKRNR
ncbi:Uncharacterised protein [Sphingobacterium thalpophilum]|uniref:Uncharacterized protein n=1 Tax=Sphingobacterium thalpophilum TaxID=259 RepID=A0A4U9VX69_9SPHI|nr:Uncharacterised protein [Sphingobacterium thalpophilum]